jgi:hypothetical protein
MAWKPYSVEELEEVLKSEREDLSAEELAKFERLKVPLKRVPCWRGEGTTKDDGLFLVAADGETTVVFDDIDEEFAFCNARQGDVIREWSLAGGLYAALGKLKDR